MKRLGSWYKETILGWLEGKDFKKVAKGYLLAYAVAVITLGPVLTIFPDSFWAIVIWAFLYIALNVALVAKEMFR